MTVRQGKELRVKAARTRNGLGNIAGFHALPKRDWANASHGHLKSSPWIPTRTAERDMDRKHDSIHRGAGYRLSGNGRENL